jgi:hypothetical protein
MAGTKIFISYRRDDTADEAKRLEEQLEELQGGVFRDVSDIEAGDHFPKKLEKALSESDFVIVVIGKKWMSVRDQRGNLRINDPRDFVRREISYAFRRIEKDEFVDIIPVLVQGARMPKRDELPGDICTLADINAHRIAGETFEEDVVELSKRIGALAKKQSQKAGNVLDEIDEIADFEGGLGKIISLRPAAAKNPAIRDLPELATWHCSVISPEFAGGRLDLQFETRQSQAFDGEFLSGRRDKIEGHWQLGIGRGGSLVLGLKGNTHEGYPVELHIPIEQKAGERSYSGRDDSGRFYRLEWLRRGREPEHRL